MTLFSKQLPLPVASRIWDGALSYHCVLIVDCCLFRLPAGRRAVRVPHCERAVEAAGEATDEGQRDGVHAAAAVGLVGAERGATDGGHARNQDTWARAKTLRAEGESCF